VILRLLQIAAAKLQANGLLLLETVNPSCPTALGNFYLDPTHVRPVPAQMLSFMAESAGFTIEQLKFSENGGAALPQTIESSKDMPATASSYMDYAIIARCRPS
jgi:O-antigen chain-terminating methyltransferase